ncbi:matrixin family metalloprotease [Litorilituus lipolyticus]|nr:matrixin family metalloprotease [Litorilituus lipolyticus]
MVRVVNCLTVAILLLASVQANAGAIAKWGAGLGTGATISWSIMDGGLSCELGTVEPAGCVTSSLDSFMPAGYKSEIERAFDAWSIVADLTFIEVLDQGEDVNVPSTSGIIRVGAHAFDGPSGVLAHGYFPSNSPVGGDIHFDSTDIWKIGFAGVGIDIFQVMAHELGHALGLGHSDDGFIIPELPPGPALMDPFYSEAFSGPQAADIAYIQFLYGAAKNTEIPVPPTLALFMIALIGLAARRKV